MGDASDSIWMITIAGLVQGVGFRPFVSRLANELGVSGWVRNSTIGVQVMAKSAESRLVSFADRIRAEAPQGSYILSCTIERLSPMRGEETAPRQNRFYIRQSQEYGPSPEAAPALVSPDVSICPECSHEFQEPGNLRYQHPFISCAACGPRFTIISSLPYDRNRTTMDVFPMCLDCGREYLEPLDRRHHAQTVACPNCGPTIELMPSDFNGQSASSPSTILGRVRDRLTADPSTILNKVRAHLVAGHIIAVKGIGGFHLACDARNDTAIAKLRRLKRRPEKPLAVMFRDLPSLQSECECSEEVARILNSPAHPIVILPRKSSSTMPKSLGPGLSTLGAMLPYTGLHMLLFGGNLDAIVVTSGNSAGSPIAFSIESVRAELGQTDGILTHDRVILNPLDDSVVAVSRLDSESKRRCTHVLLRRSRGYAPLPVSLPTGGKTPLLGTGSDSKGCFCLGRNGLAFPSPYLGDLANAQVLERYRYMLGVYGELLHIRPELIACDLHPQWVTSQLIARGDYEQYPLIQVQHHHAHIAACMAENGVSRPVLGLAFDGTGYGTDGHVWGGEFILSSLHHFQRLAHLEYTALPGGDKAISEPWRMAVSYLRSSGTEDAAEILVPHLDRREAKVAYELDSEWSALEPLWPKSSSMGRLFDATAALLGLCVRATYDGQPAAILEDAAWHAVLERGPESIPPYEIPIPDAFDRPAIPFSPLINCIVRSIRRGDTIPTIAARFHRTVAAIAAEVSNHLCNQHKLTTIALSGGVWQNLLLRYWTVSILEEQGLTVICHERLSPNDECIGYGQVAVAGAQVEMGKGGH